MDLSIVIVSFNTKDITLSCLDSIFRYTNDILFEVIVVDNMSSDGSPEAIRSKFPNVNLIVNTANLGFAAGQNLGILQSKGKYVLILNSDIIFLENSCKKMIEVFSSKNSLGMLGPKIVNSDGSHAISARRANLSPFMLVLSVINRHFRFKKLINEQFFRKYFGKFLGKFHDNYNNNEGFREADYIDGMCVMVPRNVLKEVGLFDERYFFDFEIIDLANRIRQSGKKVEYHPVTKLIHIGQVSRKKISKIVVETHKSEIIYYWTYNHNILPILLKTIKYVVGLKLFIENLKIFSKNKKNLDDLTIYRSILTWSDNIAWIEAAKIPKLSEL